MQELGWMSAHRSRSPPSSPLLTCPNVVIFPHIGSATVAAREGMADLAGTNVLALAARHKMPTQVELGP